MLSLRFHPVQYEPVAKAHKIYCTGPILLLGGLVLLAGCETSFASCWPTLEEKHIAFYSEFDSATHDPEQLQEARQYLNEALSSCSAEENFFSDNSRLGIDADSRISLLDMAIISNDRELTRVYAAMLASEATPFQSDRLLYGGEYLNLAAFFDSILAVRELLNLGFDPNAVGQFGMTALHSSSVVSTHGLSVIRELVDSGGDLEAKASNGETPIMMARRKGNLPKVQCLYLLGARIEDLEGQSEDMSAGEVEATQRIDDFLSSANKVLPVEVSQLCSANQRRSGND